MRGNRLVWLLIAFVLAMPSLADHLPPNLISRTAPERTLGFITLEQTTVGDLVKRYGKPEVKSYPDDGDASRGERSYDWQLADCRLSVGTWFQPGKETAVTSVEVWGGKASHECSTGNGLSLGASMADLRRIYGRFQQGRKSTDQSLYALVEFRDESQADIDFDHADKVNHIQLRTSVE